MTEENVKRGVLAKPMEWRPGYELLQFNKHTNQIRDESAAAEPPVMKHEPDPEENTNRRQDIATIFPNQTGHRHDSHATDEAKRNSERNE